MKQFVFFITCGQRLYEAWGVGWDLGSECILLTETKIPVMLYLYGEEFQVLTTCDNLVVRWQVTCSKAGTRIGRKLVPLLSVSEWD